VDADYGSHEAFTRAFRDHFVRMADAPTFERCEENFAPVTGNGGFEI